MFDIRNEIQAKMDKTKKSLAFTKESRIQQMSRERERERQRER